jgi:hypothetical protein
VIKSEKGEEVGEKVSGKISIEFVGDKAQKCQSFQFETIFLIVVQRDREEKNFVVIQKSDPTKSNNQF